MTSGVTRKLPFGKPIIGREEHEAVAAVLDSGILVHGVRAGEFEQAFSAFIGGGHAVSVASCTAGLHLAYFDLGVGPGHEVIVPAQTHTATAHAVELTGARPVFVDAEIETGNIDLAALESALTERTRAISVVHYLGLPVEMNQVMALARTRGLFVVEDCALAVGSYYRGVHAGLLGDVGVFSFYPVKHMTTGEGGMVVSTDPAIARRLTRKRAFGVDRHVGERAQPGIYDVTMLGFNYRLNELAAALGIEQLKRMSGFLERRRANYEALAAALRSVEGLTFLRSTGGDCQSSYYCLSALLDERLAARREEIVRHLAEGGVGTSVYYPHAVPHLTYYRQKYGYGAESFPVAAAISRRSIALPVGPHVDPDDMLYIAELLADAIKKVG